MPKNNFVILKLNLTDYVIKQFCFLLGAIWEPLRKNTTVTISGSVMQKRYVFLGTKTHTEITFPGQKLQRMKHTGTYIWHIRNQKMTKTEILFYSILNGLVPPKMSAFRGHKLIPCQSPGADFINKISKSKLFYSEITY